MGSLHFTKIVQARVDSVKLGGKRTVMMYGPTISGKSHIMFGCSAEPEIIYKALDNILGGDEQEVKTGLCLLEIYIEEQVILIMNALVASKQFEQESILCSLVADARIQVCPKNTVNFNVDKVRVAKLFGGGLHECSVFHDMVLKTDALRIIKHVERVKIAVFGKGVDTSTQCTKGTVMIQSDKQLLSFIDCDIA
ncbi:T-complex protein 1 subunit theta-like [Cryptomeria japonica]|uniref:T-complex protein 1 subunit theta-like n=1 Tax=Cryptomeria japonica TaxID=3369 RepID=UPI0027DA9F17|nr:T-complex protein 1 subunit theta-like [Cryptomeria japonica]